jgi:restriction system protein
MKKVKGPEFIRFFRPILSILRESGATGTPGEIVDRSIEIAGVSEQEQQAVNKNGQSRIRNQVHWARQYLVWAGFLDSSRRGIWSLTEKGRLADLSKLDPLDVFKRVQKEKTKVDIEKQSTAKRDGETAPDDEELIPHRVRILEIIRALPPEGFERLGQRLLRESGFQHVSVTGRTGDGGIDGIGTLQMNPFVSFNVLFQCKRYKGAVTPSQVRDFRGAMMGRADKGIIISTGTFTLEAKKEARRDGVPPIELVDGEALVDMFEKLEVGLIPRQTFDVDEKFFEEFKK